MLLRRRNHLDEIARVRLPVLRRRKHHDRRRRGEIRLQSAGHPIFVFLFVLIQEAVAVGVAIHANVGVDQAVPVQVLREIERAVAVQILAGVDQVVSVQILRRVEQTVVVDVLRDRVGVNRKRETNLHRLAEPRDLIGSGCDVLDVEDRHDEGRDDVVARDAAVHVVVQIEHAPVVVEGTDLLRHLGIETHVAGERIGDEHARADVQVGEPPFDNERGVVRKLGEVSRGDRAHRLHRGNGGIERHDLQLAAAHTRDIQQAVGLLDVEQRARHANLGNRRQPRRRRIDHLDK